MSKTSNKSKAVPENTIAPDIRLTASLSSRPWLLLLVLVPWLIYYSTGKKGLDYGFHWDEPALMTHVVYSLHKGILLPGDYLYPGLIYWLHYMVLVPDIPAALRYAEARHMKLPEVQINEIRQRYNNAAYGRLNEQEREMFDKASYVPWVGEYMQGVLVGKPFNQRLRNICLFLSSLTIFFGALIVYVWRHNSIEALAAACFIAFSWEFAYHGRWIATDAILCQFLTLTILFLVVAWKRPQASGWLYAAAVAAGLATGTKYTAGILLFVVMGAAVLRARETGAWRRLPAQLGICLFVFALVFYLTTPAILLDPIRFFESLSNQQYVYSHANGAGNAMNPGWDHLSRNLYYMAAILSSPYRILALLIFSLSAVGFYHALREMKWIGLVIFSYPLLLLYLISTHCLSNIRNLLPLLPFMAVTASVGAGCLIGRLRAPFQRAAWGGIAVVMAINAGWLIHAAETIQKRGTDAFMRDLANYVQSENNTIIYLSPVVSDLVSRMGILTKPNLTTNFNEAKVALFTIREAWKDQASWCQAVPFVKGDWFGPYEVNLNMYPTWGGDDRVVRMNARDARRIGLPASMKVLK